MHTLLHVSVCTLKINIACMHTLLYVPVCTLKINMVHDCHSCVQAGALMYTHTHTYTHEAFDMLWEASFVP